MRMRPSLRCARMRPPPLRARNCLPGEAGLASPAGPVAFAHRNRAPARPGEPDELPRQARGQLGLAAAVDRVHPFDERLAELARPVARIHLVEDAALARRAVLDVGVARE